jgi:Tol biopolymer transport system component
MGYPLTVSQVSIGDSAGAVNSAIITVVGRGQVNRRGGWIWIGLAALGATLACACTAMGIAGVWWLAHRNESAPLPQPQAQVGGRIAYIGADGDIYTMAPDGSDPQTVTRDLPVNGTQYEALAWSPDGRLAFSSHTDEASALFTSEPDGSDRKQVYSGGPDVAPFYLYWSPDSQWITFLTSSQAGVDLRMADSHAGDSSQIVAQGSPSYFSWSPDSQSLLLHTGGARRDSSEASLAIFQPASSALVKLPDAPGIFQAPAWSPDGRQFLFARETETKTDELVLAEGDDRRVLASSRTGLAFAWSPRGDRVAFAIPNPQNDFLYDSVVVTDLEGQNRRVVAQNTIAAFFWSPDGKQIAVLSFDSTQLNPQGRLVPARGSVVPVPQSANVKLIWSLTNVADGTSVAFPSFTPTDSFLQVVPYFDQYTQSLSLWSPDGRYLLFADVDESDRPAIRVLDTLQPLLPARRLADGTLAVWSWH